jgi:hypothetical protein
MAVLHAITCVARALVAEKWQPLERQKRADTDALNTVLLATTHTGEQAMIRDRDFLEAFGIHAREARAREVWQHLIESVVAPDRDFSGAWAEAAAVLLTDGPLARRIVRAVAGENPSVAARISLDHDRLRDVYRELCDCLRENRMFRAET